MPLYFLISTINIYYFHNNKTNKLFFNDYLFFTEREREKVSRGRAERVGDRILSGIFPESTEPDVGLKLTNHEIMSWAEVTRLTN